MFTGTRFKSAKTVCAVALGIAALVGSAPSVAQNANEQYFSVAVVPCRTVRPRGRRHLRRPDRLHDVHQYQGRRRRRHQADVGRVRDRIPGGAGRRVLRAPQDAQPDEGHDGQSGLDADRVRPARQDGRRQGAARHDRLRPHRHHRRPLLPVGVSAHGHVSDAGHGDRQVPVDEGEGQPARQEDRLPLSRLGVRQGAHHLPAGRGQGQRLRADDDPRDVAGHGAGRAVAADSPVPGRLRDLLGLRRDEPGRDEGRAEGRLPARQDDRQHLGRIGRRHGGRQARPRKATCRPRSTSPARRR